MVSARPIILTIAVAGIALRAAAQEPPRPVHWSLSISDGDAGSLVATLRAAIDPGWHLYSMTQPSGGPGRTRIIVLGDPPFRLAGAITRRAPDTIPDANFGIMSEVYDDSVTFRLPIGGWSRTGRLLVGVTFQACTARLCLLPRTDSVSVSVRRAR